MQFFKIILFFGALAFALQANASGLLDTVITREYGSCQTNNLRYSAMKFYKIPINERGQNLFLRALFFFNADESFRLRLTKQELLGCQTLPSGDQACSYRPVADEWFEGHFSTHGNQIIDTNYAYIIRMNDDLNRGFRILFKSFLGLEIKYDDAYVGGMVETNFDQFGNNTINICR